MSLQKSSSVFNMQYSEGAQVVLVVRNPPASAGDTETQVRSRRSPRERNGNPLQCFCLESPRDRGAWWAALYWVAESDTTEAT